MTVPALIPDGIISAETIDYQATGLIIPEGLPYEEWELVGGGLEAIANGWQWWYGDWWNYGESRYGEKHAQALPEKDYNTKSTAASVAARIEFLRRRKNLSFGHHREIAYQPRDEQDEWLDQAEKHDWSVHELRSRIRESNPADPDTEPPTSDTDWQSKDKRMVMLAGDFRHRLYDLKAGSVDTIFTDPPYPKDDLPLWSDLGQVAEHLLGKRGLLVAYTGQIFLPEVIERLSEHLTYGWTYALQLPGSGSRIMGRHIIQAWKPIVAFSTGTWPSGEWGDDWLISPSREKDQYEWQQNTVPAQRLIERMVPTNGLVVDPFVGVGSFGVAAKRTGCRFVGVEIDKSRFEKAVTNIGNA